MNVKLKAYKRWDDWRKTKGFRRRERSYTLADLENIETVNSIVNKLEEEAYLWWERKEELEGALDDEVFARNEDLEDGYVDPEDVCIDDLEGLITYDPFIPAYIETVEEAIAYCESKSRKIQDEIKYYQVYFLHAG